MSADKNSSSPHLLYSEYIKTNDAKHVVHLIESKNKEKPVMRFTKSSVLSKVLDLLPRLEQGEADLKTKHENELNIEVCDENCPAIEMNVAIPKDFQHNNSEVLSENSNEASSETTDSEEDSEESNGEDESSSEESDDENVLSSGTQKTLQKGKENIFKNENLTHNLTNIGEFSSRSKCIKSSSPSLINTDNVSDEPPAKKLCQLIE